MSSSAGKKVLDGETDLKGLDGSLAERKRGG